MRKIKSIFNLLLMELSYQYGRTNAIMWREDFIEHPSLYRKKLQKLIEESKRSGHPWVHTQSSLEKVKLSLRDRWRAWSEDGATLTTRYDELESKIAQWWEQQSEILQDNKPPNSKDVRP